MFGEFLVDSHVASLEIAFEKLLEENVVVTNQSDKLLQIARLKFLEPMLKLLAKHDELKLAYEQCIVRGVKEDEARPPKS